jgi:hypothetical protein
MATVYSDLATIQNAPHVGDSMNIAAKEGGKIRVVIASYEAAALAANDIINICKLRKGDIVLPQSLVMHDDLGTGTTMDIGDNDSAGADADRYVDGIDTAAAASVAFFNQVAEIDKIPYVIQNDCWLQATNLGAAATGTIDFYILISRFGG